ncbi:NACHT domain-containing NTPase [Caulobacter sp. B11]|uniref:NACHT domain-containing protein n=1 Tax=Caulobacter sp. B11 TaxID=2048899 RepID=UPI001374770D|nr:hypothetical protein [Caulobacter sp. B11]
MISNTMARNPAKDLIVFQVKYVKNVADTRDERDMVEAVIKSEKAKVEKLKSAGISKYYLITNIKGTSHLNAGSIDRVNDLLTKEFGIESYCWWRDDIDRRLDGNASVKWSYPEILKATDLLQALIEGHLGEDEARRKSAIRAYMTAQYDDEQELKFKQTDLRSTMVDLFVDLPMRRTYDPVDVDHIQSRHVQRSDLARYANSISLRELEDTLNSAEYFLTSNTINVSQRIVLEGAPGQGKSTVTQFICQVMRMKLLGKGQDILSIPEALRATAVRIPFRVDLRDLAKWIAGTDPFQPRPTDLDEKEPRSLEGFLAGQVRFLSGGHEFNVSDLSAVARASHMLLALDGFDEVADVELRKQLVAEITKGSARLVNAGSFSVQTIVTSRPAAFAKSIRFPREQWVYFELLPLERNQVDAYAAKWMKAKGIKEAERLQLSKILESKLAEAHTQFLAKNPMQLTILLSLINNRGASLPEKRTAMYDAYMDMFFSRESEKSNIVRDNRELLIDIHRYLAWKLQTAAEGGENGSIERGALRQMLLIYLDSQGEDTGIVGELFDGIIERVGALVSRVQETYEFEVQPLREYFAARHLYETAPYSPAGDEKNGTKLDRFDALIKNPYWLNVARFYGGCFSKGEISALVDELTELSGTSSFSITSHPRSVALMLLCDWVFTQYQPAVRRIVALVGQHPQLRQLLANAEAGAGGWSSLPDRSGRAEFLDILWGRISAAKQNDEKYALASAITRNSPIRERIARWEASRENFDNLNWARLGRLLGVFHSEDLYDGAILEGGFDESIVISLLESERFDILEKFAEKAAVNVMLNSIRLPGYVGADAPGRIGCIAAMLGFNQYAIALNDESGVPLKHALDRRNRMGRSEKRKPGGDWRNKVSAEELNALEAYDNFLNTPTTVTSTTLEPWVKLVEAMRRAWGDSPAIDRIAFMASGVRSKEALGVDSGLKGAPNLVAVARFVRLKSGAPRWWADRLSEETSSAERRRLLLLLWLWATPKTILKISESISNALNSLRETDWIELCRDYHCLEGRLKDKTPIFISDIEVTSMTRYGARSAMFMGMRVGRRAQVKFGAYIADAAVKTAGSPELQFAMDTILGSSRKAGELRSNLNRIECLYSRGALARHPFTEDLEMSTFIAKRISEDPERYPLPLVSQADSHLRSLFGASASKLLDVASRERWFQ